LDIRGGAAFVTGGASGIGLATVVALAERGASVVFVDRDEDGARQTMALTRYSDKVVFRACDVTDGKDLAAAVDSAVERFGRLDMAVNVAGVGDGDLFADDPGDWRRVIDIDLTALIDSTRLAVRAMRRAGNGGVIVNLASWLGLYPMPFAPVYSAAKAGVVGFTRSLATLADDCGIRVNAVCPELVDTPLGVAMTVGKVMTAEMMAGMRASQSVLTPEDVAEWVVRLVEDDRRAGAILQLTKAEGATYVENCPP
jgi:15-hydroxyprostaglandin dehydrogenase (NAD)